MDVLILAIFTSSTGSVLAAEDHSVRRGLQGGMGNCKEGALVVGDTVHLSCFYSNCWPQAGVSDNYA